MQGDHSSVLRPMLPVEPRIATPHGALMRSRPNRTAQGVQGRRRRHAVDAIQHAAVARQQRAAVLEPGGALEHALGQIADDREYPDGAAEGDAGATGRPKCARADAGDQRHRAQPAERALPGLAGLTRGASLCRPKLRPAKKAPMSAAITSSSSHSTICGPRAKPSLRDCSRASATNAGTSTGTPHSRANARPMPVAARAQPQEAR